MQPNSATLLHGYLYVLEPPVGSTGGYRTLLRIDTTTPAATGTITTAPPTTASASNATVVLRGSGVNGIAFGTIQASAITEIDKLLGPPSSTAPLNQFGGCGIDSTMQWPTLTAYFSRGAFVGYSTLAANGTTLPSGNQATTKGLRAGDQLSQAERIYGAAITTSFAQGGSWTATTPTGKIEGYQAERKFLDFCC